MGPDGFMVTVGVGTVSRINVYHKRDVSILQLASVLSDNLGIKLG